MYWLGPILMLIFVIFAFRKTKGMYPWTWFQGKKSGFKAWHFLPKSQILRFGDGRPVIEGKTLTVSTESVSIRMCSWGMHASVDLWDALRYAPDLILTRVLVKGSVTCEPDKLVGTSRTCLKIYSDLQPIFVKWALQIIKSKLPRENTTLHVCLDDLLEMPDFIPMYRTTAGVAGSGTLLESCLRGICNKVCMPVASMLDWGDIFNSLIPMTTRKERKQLIQMLREAGVLGL